MAFDPLSLHFWWMHYWTTLILHSQFPVTDLRVTSVVAFSRGRRVSIIFSHWTSLIANRHIQCLWLTERWEKGKHEKPLESRNNIKQMMSQRRSFWMTINTEWCKEWHFIKVVCKETWKLGKCSCEKSKSFFHNSARQWLDQNKDTRTYTISLGS